MAFAFKLQSPNYDAAGAGYEIPLPAVMDSLKGQSMAAILTMFNGENQTFDLKQLTEIITLTGFFTDVAAVDAGFVNAVQMRDELRRTRLRAGPYGKNTGAAASWLDEGSGGGSWTSVALVAAGEADAATSRFPGTMRLVYDSYYNPATGLMVKLFAYGTILDFDFGPRPASTTRTRIPFMVRFGIGTVRLG